MVDENDPRTSRIVFCDKGGNQGLPAPGVSTLGPVIDGAEYGYNPMSECFCFPFATDVHTDLCPSPRQERLLAVLKGEKASQRWCPGVRVDNIVSFAFC